jgi:deoxyribose-phosphate aldolase
MSADKLARVYVKIRDARNALKSKFEEEDAELEEQLSVIAQQLLEICKDTGADTLKTSGGTVMRTVKTRYWTSDWEAMYDLIATSGELGLLEKRIHQGNLKEFLQENPNLMPKGLNVDNRYDITVRRAAK